MEKNNQIMVVECMALDTSKLSNKALILETEKLAKTQNKAFEAYETARAALNAQRMEQAKIFARVQDTKLYEKDNFKNMSEYCEAVGFSASKSLISQLVAAGRVYNDKNAPDSLKSVPFSNLGAMSKVINDKDAREQLYKDVESGAFKGETQEACADYSACHSTAKAAIVKTYKATLDGAPIADEDGKTRWDTLDGWKSYFTGASTEYFKLPNGKVSPDSNKSTVNRAAVIEDGKIHLLVYTEYTQVNGEVKTSKGISADDVRKIGKIAAKIAKGESLSDGETTLAKSLGLID